MKKSKLLKVVTFILAAICIGGLFNSFTAAGIGGLLFSVAPVLGKVDYSSAIKELREQLAGKQTEMRQLINLAETEKRDFSEDEETRYAGFEKEVEGIEKRIARLEAAEKLIAGKAHERKDADDKDNKEQRTKEVDAAFRNFLRFGASGMTESQRQMIEENRALSAVTGASGGYTVPEGFSGILEEAMKSFGGVMEVAQIMDTETGNDIDYPTVNDTSNKGAILGENTSAGTSTDPGFGTLKLKAFTYSSKPVLIPNQLLQDNAVNLEQRIADMLVTRIMRAFAEHAAGGAGTTTPQGVTVGGTKGVDATVDAITYDNLVDLMHSVDPIYRKNGVWMLHDNTLKALKKLKDGNGQYIFQVSLRDDEPSTILGKKFIINNDMPEIGASTKSVVFGDFSKYLIRRVKGYSVKRLVERYADYNQTGFILFVRMDGRVIDAGTHPLKYIEHAAS